MTLDHTNGRHNVPWPAIGCPSAAAAVGGTVAVVGGIIGGVIQSGVAKNQQAHVLAVRREERTMQRRATVYVDLLVTMQQAANQAMLPILEAYEAMLASRSMPELPQRLEEFQYPSRRCRKKSSGCSQLGSMHSRAKSYRRLVWHWQVAVDDFSDAASRMKDYRLAQDELDKMAGFYASRQPHSSGRSAIRRTKS